MRISYKKLLFSTIFVGVVLVCMNILRDNNEREQILHPDVLRDRMGVIENIKEENGGVLERTDPYADGIEQFQIRVEHLRKVKRLVYNRVPKCGSTAVHVTMGNLAKIYNYTIHISSIFTDHHIPHARQQTLVDNANKLQEPWIFDRHVFFVNFSAHASAMPVYINNIRDPVDRISSWYYFIRFQRNHIRPMSDERRMRTFDDCVLQNYEECVSTNNFTDFYNFMLVPYFCGHEDFCLMQTRKALEQAKKNVMNHYAVVGLMEDLPNFFSVLEYILPQYFKGALKDYTDNANKLSRSFSTHKKIPPSEQAKNKMKSLIPLEYEFYHFVKQRFYHILGMVRELQESDNKKNKT